MISRKTELKLEPVSLQQVVSAAVVATQGAADSHRREVTVEMPEDALFVNADAPRLEQALANVLHNAVKYSPQQGRIRVRVAREGQEALMCVQDQG